AGTAKRTGDEIVATIENVGGLLDLGGAGGSVKVLAPDRRLGLGLLLECISQPSFPRHQFDLQRDRLLSSIADAEREPDTRAQQVYRAQVYGKHPYGRSGLGTRKTVSALTPDDVRAFHRQVFVPNNTVLAVVGDFDRKQVIDEIKQLTAGWKTAALA